MIKSIDEAWSPAAQALAESRASSMTQQQVSKSETMATKKIKLEKKAQSQPAKKDSSLPRYFSELSADIIFGIKKAGFSEQRIRSVLHLWANQAITHLVPIASAEFVRGLNVETGGHAHLYPHITLAARDIIVGRISFYCNKLADDTYRLLMARCTVEGADVVAAARSVFDSLGYRAKFISNVEPARAYWYGRLLGIMDDNSEVELIASPDACDKCRALAGTYKRSELDVGNIPPHHSDCVCVMSQKET